MRRAGVVGKMGGGIGREEIGRGEVEKQERGRCKKRGEGGSALSLKIHRQR